MALGLDQTLKIIVSAVDQASSTLGNIRTAVQDLQSDASTTAQTLETIGSGLQGVGRDMTKYVTAPVVAGLGLATKVAGDFEAQLTILEVTARGSGVEIDTLRAAAIALGEDTRLVGVDAAEAADMMTVFMKNGQSLTDMFGDLEGYLAGTTELSGTLRAAIDLAASSELNLTEAAEVLTTTMNTYNLTAEDAVGIANLYVQTADASVASVSDLTQSVASAGTVLAGFNVTLPETLLMLSLLSERGVTGAEAGTALRSMYNSMLQPTNRNTEALAALNMELYDSEQRLKSPITLMGEFNQALDGTTDQERIQALQDIFGFYGLKAAAPLVEQGAAGFELMGEKIDNAATTAEVAEARTDTFNQAVENLQGVLQTFMITAGTPFIEDFLRPAVEAATELVQKLNEMNPETLNLALRIALIAAVVGPALIALGTLARSIASLITLYQLLAGAQAAAGLGAGAAGAAGAAAGGAGLGAAGTALTALPAVGALGVIGAAAYATTHEEEVTEAQVNARDWLRNLIGLPDYDPNRSPLEQLWWSKQGAAEDDEPAGPWQYIPSATGEDLYFPEMPVEVPDIALAEEATTTAADWVGEFESAMAQYDSVFATIGTGAGDQIKAGLETAAEDFGSMFLTKLAESLSPELVPYIRAEIAAAGATSGGQE